MYITVALLFVLCLYLYSLPLQLGVGWEADVYSSCSWNTTVHLRHKRCIQIVSHFDMKACDSLRLRTYAHHGNLEISVAGRTSAESESVSLTLPSPVRDGHELVALERLRSQSY